MGSVPYQEPDFLPWDGRRVPITFIGGYLGAGKTTLINELLARTDRPIAVLVNDVGEINIDAALIRKRTGDTIELTDGCVCCSLIDGFGEAFDQIRRRETPPDQVVVELSGLAEPDRVRPWGRSAGFVLDGIVVLIDAEHFLHRLEDPALTEALLAQVRSADLLILTKLDLASPQQSDEVRDRLHSIAPATRLISLERAVDASAILALGGRQSGGVTADLPAPSLFDAHVIDLIPLADPIDAADLDALLKGLDDRVVRAKGVARLTDDSLALIQMVGRRFSVTPLPAPERQSPTDLVVVTLKP